MSLKRSFREEHFSCPVCNDIFKDPVLLNCSHSVCKVCLKQFWDNIVHRECPVCGIRSVKVNPPSNLALKNLCEAFRLEKSQGDSQQLCNLHSEKLKLFCLDDEQTVCLVCRDSKEHRNHIFGPTDEIARQYKEELETWLSKLQEMKTNEDMKRSYDKIDQHIKMQTQHTKKQIKEEFEKLHQFLRDEEAVRIAALREEEEQKSQMMKEKMNKDMTFLSDAIRGIEEKLKTDDVTFLQSYKSTVERAQCTLQDPERVSGALINVAKHLGNLKFRVWEKMQEIAQYTPVILDPNTAHPQLVLSEDLTSVIYSTERQQLPDNPERFDGGIIVLGSEAFDSGIRCWNVEVGENDWWFLGVMTEFLQRKGPVASLNGRWGMLYSDGKYLSVFPSSPSKPLPWIQKPQRIRVQVDYNGGKLSFFDHDDNTHLHTITQVFIGRVFPYFSSLRPLRILPVKATIWV